MAAIHIGTSGWHYDHWIGPFYPVGSAADHLLEHYARHFSAVEINATFYRLPKRQTVAAWRDATPSGFVFTCKARRYMTHMKKLSDPQESLDRFVGTMAELRNKLGPVLFQLPPRWHVNLQRLAAFLEILPTSVRYAFEFRDQSWFCDAVNEIMQRRNVAFCIHDLAGHGSPLTATADFIYIRLHGPDGFYRGSYGTRALQTWAGRIDTWRKGGRDVFCFFNNDPQGHAVQDALRLKALLAESAAPDGSQ